MDTFEQKHRKRNERAELRQRLVDNRYRIANDIEFAIIVFIDKSEKDVYPTKHINEIVNHLEEVDQLLIPSYESGDIVRALTYSLEKRGILGRCCDVMFDHKYHNMNSGWRIPDNSVRQLIHDHCGGLP